MGEVSSEEGRGGESGESRTDLDRRPAARTASPRFGRKKRPKEGKWEPTPRDRSRLDRGIGARGRGLKYPKTAANAT